MRRRRPCAPAAQPLLSRKSPQNRSSDELAEVPPTARASDLGPGRSFLGPSSRHLRVLANLENRWELLRHLGVALASRAHFGITGEDPVFLAPSPKRIPTANPR